MADTGKKIWQVSIALTYDEYLTLRAGLLILADQGRDRAEAAKQLLGRIQTSRQPITSREPGQ